MRATAASVSIPEDIESLFGEVPVGTKVTVVNQPLLAAWQGDSLYVQSFPVPVEGEDDSKAPAPVAYDDKVAALLQRIAGEHGASGRRAARRAGRHAGAGHHRARVAPGPDDRSLPRRATRRVENVVPEGSNWDGTDGPPAAGSGAPQ